MKFNDHFKLNYCQQLITSVIKLQIFPAKEALLEDDFVKHDDRD